MPGGDRTGPMGYGPATGWGRGPCGKGFRRGRWNWFSPWPSRDSFSRDEEKDMLQKEIEGLEKEKNEMKRRLERLENE